MDTKSTLQNRLSAIQIKAAYIGDLLANGTGLTSAQESELKGLANEAIEIKAQLIAMERGEANASLTANLGNLGNVKTDPGLNGHAFTGATSDTKSGYLDFTPKGIKSLARQMAAPGIKSLTAAGAVTTNVEVAPEPVRLPGGGLSLLSALPVIQHSAPTWKYLRQTVRTNNADVVAPGATKPTSVVTIDDIDGALKVFATLSEPIDKYLLKDNAALERFVSQELLYMVGSKVQAAAVAAFLGASGIQTVSAAASPIVSVRKGIQAVEDLGYNADLIVLNSEDYFEIVTTRNAGGSFDVSGGVGAEEETPKLWGRDVVSVTSGVASGSALVLDRSAVAIDTDQTGIETEWNPYAGFDSNQVKARTEGRFDFSIFSPAALAKVALAGA
ncbi:phage major capsid protein [Leifsonia sp. NCR5]|uniref:phage major capsid protein n=1 Tax=Leifsonia sp. NCR5 TaxID=1978342 RepID=UPI000A190E64|nr:phage major capsid protein [Leifsonia sp. NCR5]